MVLRATPERIWYKDQSDTRHSSLVHILSLEISVRDMTRPPAFDSDLQYVVRETDDERASEISKEFYPEGKWAADEHADLAGRTGVQDEQRTRICELAGRLGYREVQTRMLLGQWAADLSGLERRLRDQLDQQMGKARTSPDPKGNENVQAGPTPRSEPFAVEG